MQVNKTRDDDFVPMIPNFSATRHFHLALRTNAYDALALNQNHSFGDLLERGVDGAG
jgi:hypothetical protein